MRIIIDAMGGDNAPAAIVQGAVDAQKEFGVDIVLVGQEEAVKACLESCGAAGNEHIRVVHAEEVITMCDDPATACRVKRDSSMTVALNLLKKGEGDALVSAGSTGALLTGATLFVKRITGIRRAAVAPVIPNGEKGVLLIDSGANAECSEEYLMQFAFMGSFYAQTIMGIENPRVALLNNGAEESKGTEMHRRSYALLKEAAATGRLNFVGNVEGGDVFFDKCDVIVSDGFAGNILLKSIEGTAKFMMKKLKGAFMSSLKAKIGALLVKKGVYQLKSLLDVSEVGGTPFLGITKPVIKAHGNSNARAIRSAVKQAIGFVEGGFIEKINENIEILKVHTGEEG